MVYSRSTQYAIRAMAHLATSAVGEFVRTEDIARSTGIPLPFLSKITQALARRGLVDSMRGRGGGVSLVRPPREITLEDIVLAVDGLNITDACVLGLASCSDDTPCPVHHVWKGLREQIRQSLHERTLEDLARSLETKKTVRKGTTRGRRPGRATRRRRRV